ncbi:hypothetical protein PM082_002924 [Marasmius tenuissimus]|nr:hypothetical protein PM082_002924 [Marasmius tenuissimus]
MRKRPDFADVVLVMKPPPSPLPAPKLQAVEDLGTIRLFELKIAIAGPTWTRGMVRICGAFCLFINTDSNGLWPDVGEGRANSGQTEHKPPHNGQRS